MSESIVLYDQPCTVIETTNGYLVRYSYVVFPFDPQQFYGIPAEMWDAESQR